MNSKRTSLPGTVLERWNREVSEGKSQHVRSELLELNLKRVGRADKAAIASLARRVELPDLSLKILRDHIYPKTQRSNETATPEEKIAYAAALVRVGAVAEALRLLNRVDRIQHPEASLFLAHAFFAQWDYFSAEKPLLEFLSNSHLTESQRIVGQLNLAAVLLSQRRYSETKIILEDLLRTVSREKFSRFRGNALELSAQLAIRTKDWERALHFLEEAQTLVSGTPSLDAFFVRKWRVVLELKQNGPTKPLIEKFTQLRAEAQALKHWESIRDLDYHRAVITSDVPLAIHLHFGTPFEHFRKRLFREWAGPLEIPETYSYVLNPRLAPFESFELSALVGRSGTSLGLPEKLVRLFFSDFYRPFRVAELLAELHPEEHYDPINSPLRIYKTIEAAKKLLSKVSQHLSIVAVDSGYVLQSERGCEVRLSIADRKPQGSPLLLLLKKHFETDEYFTSADLSEVLGVPARKAVAEIKDLVETGDIEKMGSGRATTYKLAC